MARRPGARPRRIKNDVARSERRGGAGVHFHKTRARRSRPWRCSRHHRLFILGGGARRGGAAFFVGADKGATCPRVIVRGPLCAILNGGRRRRRPLMAAGERGGWPAEKLPGGGGGVARRAAGRAPLMTFRWLSEFGAVPPRRYLFNDLWKTLSMHDMSSGLIQAPQSLYRGSSACVRINGAYTDRFDTCMVVRRGCVASPWLFNLFMDSCLCDLEKYECGLRIDELSVKYHLYADNQ
ncbi:hypothetical protein EVAR_47464_1 [Eumeta japonica]|uniref:Uncharacterized protein n=1 Tax=Eumeta variegata TaxID=151549 RepID=A0A4C1XAC9_EUMVA|nr:hypothetical protein EVAR_47464_1 [Eumeta japonica]